MKSQDHPAFEQSVDVSRPHTLLTINTRAHGSLLYRYDDTGEAVTVPNIWYNQPYLTRVGAVLYEADRRDEFATRIESCPPLHVSRDSAADIARRFRERANKIRSEAVRMKGAGSDSHPVAASRIELDFGPNVGLD